MRFFALPKLSVTIAICLVTLMAGSAMAETYYVGTNGLNGRTARTASNRNTPWRSIQRGMDAARAGDTIVVLDGTYWENIVVTNSGNENNLIRLEAENQHGALIVGSITGFGIRYLVIDGFRITNRRTDAPQSKGLFFGFSHHLTIRNNRVFSCRGGGISLDQCDWLLVEWNITHHNAFFDPDQHSGISIYQPQEAFAGRDAGRPIGIVVRNNTSFSNENLVNNRLFGRPTDGNGIVIDDTRNETAPTGNFVTYPRRILVENNLCYSNGGQGVHCFQSRDVYIRNNTCFQNLRSFDFGGEISVVDSDDVRVYNNLLVARAGRNVNLQFESRNIWWNYNLLHNGPSFGVRNGNNTIFSQPFFRPGTFELESFSPAIDAGLTQSGTFPLDVNGNQRVQSGRIELGAVEHND